MNIKNINFYIGILVSLLITGCVADRHAQNLGKEILIQVVEYDNAIQGTSRTLKSNYEKRMKKIRKRAVFQKQVAIESFTDRLAVDAVEHVILHGYLASDLRNYINKVLEAKRAKNLQYEIALASYNAKHQALLEKITFEQRELKTVKSALETLQSPISPQEQIQRLIPILKAVYEAQNKKTNSQIENPTN